MDTGVVGLVVTVDWGMGVLSILSTLARGLSFVYGPIFEAKK